MIGPNRNLWFSILLIALFGSAVSSVTVSSDVWMNEKELGSTFAGKTIAGLYPNGRGFVETFDIGGRVHYRDDRQRVNGRWSISARAFCTIYHGDASGGCFFVRRMSENCFEFYFTSRTERKAPKPEEPTWSAQAWIHDTPSTCVAGSEV